MTRTSLVALLFAASSSAVAAPRDVALGDALSAVGAAPSHQVSAAEQTEAAAAAEAAGAWPSTTISVLTTRLSPRFEAIVALPLPIFGTLGANRDVARGDFEAAVAELRASDLQLARDVALAWIALARAEARAALSTRSAKREAELEHATSEQFDAGDASHAEVVLATATAKRADALAAADDSAVDVASAELAGLVGWDPSRRLHAMGGLPAPSVRSMPSVTEHPDQLVATRRTAAQALRIAETERARWPKLAVDMETAVGDPTLPGTDYRVGITVEVPLLGHTQANVRTAQARLATARSSGVLTATQLAASLVAARVRTSAAATHAAALENDVVPAQREAADLARAAFREGQAGLVFVLEAERGLAEAEGEAIDARAEAATAFVELEWASGEVN